MPRCLSDGRGSRRRRRTTARDLRTDPALERKQIARVRATDGEIIEARQDVWGSYAETPVF
jgi:hypothetical protein